MKTSMRIDKNENEMNKLFKNWVISCFFMSSLKKQLDEFTQFMFNLFVSLTVLAIYILDSSISS